MKYTSEYISSADNNTVTYCPEANCFRI